MAMKVGVASHIYWDYHGAKLDMESAFGEIAGMGFYSTELLCESRFFPHWGTGRVMEGGRVVKGLAKSAGLKVTLHAPHYDFNIATWNEGLRAEVLRQLGDCIRLAGLLESDIVVVHPGKVASNKFPRSISVGNAVENLRSLAAEAADLGVTICLENMNASPNSLGVEAGELRRMVDEAASDRVKVCLDIAHVNTTGLSVDEFIRPLRGEIAHVHISDNLGDKGHHPLGVGNIDFNKALEAIEPYDGILNIEGWIPKNKRVYLAESRRHLLELVARHQR
jgi:sugar phosphate isomerase/epimerase